MWLLNKNMLSRLFVNMYVSSWVFCVVLMAVSIVLSCARKTYWYPRSLYDILVLSLGLNIHDPTVLPTIWHSEFLLGGMNDPSVYMHCFGWNLRGWMSRTSP